MEVPSGKGKGSAKARMLAGDWHTITEISRMKMVVSTMSHSNILMVSFWTNEIATTADEGTIVGQIHCLVAYTSAASLPSV